LAGNIDYSFQFPDRAFMMNWNKKCLASGKLPYIAFIMYVHGGENYMSGRFREAFSSIQDFSSQSAICIMEEFICFVGFRVAYYRRDAQHGGQRCCPRYFLWVLALKEALFGFLAGVFGQQFPYVIIWTEVLEHLKVGVVACHYFFFYRKAYSLKSCC